MTKENQNMKGTYYISSIATASYMAEFGISSIFILFLLYVLNFSMHLSSQVYGYYYGFAYLFPILIGYISDKYLSKSTSLTVGYISMIISQILFAVSASFYQPSNIVHETIVFNQQTLIFLIGLFFLALGASFSSLSITHIINSINKSESSRIEGFSIFYPILNMGILIGVIIMTVLVGNDNFYYYKFAFLVFALILTIALISFWLTKNRYLVDNEGNVMEDSFSTVSIREALFNFPSHLSNKQTYESHNFNLRKRISLFINSLDDHEKNKINVFIAFLCLFIIYRIGFSQTELSLIYFIDDFVKRDIRSFTIPVQAFLMLNPLFVLVLSPVLIKINGLLKERGFNLGYVNRSIIAIFLMVICFALLSFMGAYIDMGAIDKISFLWIILFELLRVISELYFSIAGYAMVGDLAPERYYSLFFGLFTATRAISMFTSGRIASFYPENPASIFLFNLPIDGLMNFFLIFVVLNLFAAVILFISRNKIMAILHSEGID